MSVIDHMPGPYSVTLALTVFGVIVSFIGFAIAILIRRKLKP